jgi:aryl-alcohol dehydrogenase-like predicted oxidoreductase
LPQRFSPLSFLPLIMQTQQLGSSDLRVTKLCLGTMTFGEQNTESDAHAQLDYAVERGINLIDTAEMYPVRPAAHTQGRTETYIGTWLAKHRAKRKDLIVATKVAGPARGMDWMRGGTNDLDRANIHAAIGASLQRLNTDYIDLYQLHWPSRNAPIFGQLSFDASKERPSVSIEETLSALDELVKAGKVRYVGVSNESAWGVMEFLRIARAKNLPVIASIQNAYSLLNRSYELDLHEACFREHVGLLAYSPLAFGQLSAKYIDNPNAHGRLTIFGKDWSPRYVRPATYAAAEKYAQLARAHGLSPASLALAFVNSRPFVASNIIGATTLAQLKENIDALEVKLSDEILAQINDIHLVMRNPAQ